MKIWGIELTLWLSSAALVVALASASFSFAQWRINARKERREIEANDPIVHAELSEAARGNGWLLVSISIQRVETVRLAAIEVTVVGATLLELFDDGEEWDGPRVPVSGVVGSTRLAIKPLGGRLNPARKFIPPPLRSDHVFWLSAPARPGAVRLRVNLRSSSLPIRHWKKTVMLTLTREMISTANVKVADTRRDVDDLL